MKLIFIATCLIATVSSYGFQRPANPTENLPAPQQHHPANGGSGGYHSIQPWTPPATSGSQGGRQPTYQQPTIVPASSPYFQTQQHVASPSISISQGSRTTSAGTSSYSVQQQFGPSGAGASQQTKRPYPDSSKQQSASSPQAYSSVSSARPIGPARPSQPSPSPLGNPVPHQWTPSFGPNVPAQIPSGASAGYQQPSNNVGHGIRAPPAPSRPAVSPTNGYPKPSAAGSNVNSHATSQTGKPANYQLPKQPTSSVSQLQTHSPTPSAGSYQIPKPSPVVSSIPKTNIQPKTPHATSYQIPKPSAALGAPHSAPSTTSTAHSYQSPKPLSVPAGPPQSQAKYVGPPANQIPKIPSAPHHTQKKPEAPLPVSQIPKPSASQSSAPSTSYLAPKIPTGSNLQQSWSAQGSQAATQPSATVGSYSQSIGSTTAQTSVQEASDIAQAKQQPVVESSSSYQQPVLSPSSAGGFTENVGVLYQAPLPLAPAENVGVLYQAPLPLASAEKPSWQQNFPQLPIEEPVKIPEAVPSKSPSSFIEDSVLAPTYEQPSNPSFFVEQPSIEPANLDRDPIRYAILDQHASPETFSTDAPESQQVSSYGSSAEHGLSQSFPSSENTISSQQWGSTEQGSSQSSSYEAFQQTDTEPSGQFQGSFDGSFHSFPETVTPPATSLQPPAYESADQYHNHHHQQLGSGASQNNGFHSSQPSLSVGAVGISQAKQQTIGGASPSKEIVAAGTSNHNQIANNQQRASPSANSRGQQSASNGKPPVAILSSESVLNVDGSFSYNYETEDGTKVDVSGFNKQVGPNPENVGSVSKGYYTYVDPEGTKISVTWVADENGFQPTGDHLPTPPPVPEHVAQLLSGFSSGHGKSARRGQSDHAY